MQFFLSIVKYISNENGANKNKKFIIFLGENTVKVVEDIQKSKKSFIAKMFDRKKSEPRIEGQLKKTGQAIGVDVLFQFSDQ